MKRIALVALLVAVVPLLSSCHLIVASLVPDCDPSIASFDAAARGCRNLL